MSLFSKALIGLGICYVVVALAAWPAGIYLRSTRSVVQFMSLKYSKEHKMLVPGSFGSGAFIDYRGTILTAAHVVENRPMCTVFYGSEYIPYARVALDLKNDLAIIAPINGLVLSFPIPIASYIMTGESVYVIGFPEGYGQTFTEGVVSVQDGRYFLTSAAIGLGSSGGPILSSHGYLVSVVSAYAAPAGGGWQGFTRGPSPDVVRGFVSDFYHGRTTNLDGGVNERKIRRVDAIHSNR